MKKAMVLLAVLALTFGAARGQTNRFDIGIESGPSLIFLRGNEIVEKYNDASVGFSAGAFFQYNFSKVLSLRTNLAFERKGAYSKIELTNELGQIIGTANHHSHFDYLTLPILLRAGFGKKVQFFINAGPYAGFLIRALSVVRGGTLPASEDNVTPRMKRFDIGISSGIGLVVPFKQKFAFTLEVRNNMGLINISALPVYGQGSIITNSTQLLFGFAYKLGMKQ